jgi:putative nucleotidyltransferase with HDIG domain
MSWVGVPLQIGGRCIGVVASYSYHSSHQLTITDLHVLKQVVGYVALVLDRQQQQERVQAEIRQVQRNQIECLASILRIRDNETEQHSQRVMELALHLAHAMGLSAEATEHVRWGALLHDIGKIGVPDHVLFHEGPLTDEHWRLMRQHPRHAEAILSSIEYLREALDIPRYHHEKWDGTGYPYGLRGEQIPLIARMFSIIDVWDALTSDRPYRAAWSQQQACRYIAEQAGKSFDPQIVAIFLAMIAE